MIVDKTQAKQNEISPGVCITHYIDKDKGSGGVSMGMVELLPGTHIKKHFHKVEDSMIVIAGEGIFIVDDTEYPIKEGMGLLAPAGVPHALKNNGHIPLRIVYTWPSVEVERFFI